MRMSLLMLLLIGVEGVALGQGPLSASIDRELKVLQSITGANDALVSKVKTDLNPVLEKISEPQNISYILGYVPPAIYDGLLESARKKVSDPSKFAEYEKDLLARRAFARKAAAGVFMVQLDRAVGLRSTQWNSAKKTVDELSKVAAIPSVFAIDQKKLSNKANKKLADCLTEEQMHFWKENGESSRVWSFSSSSFQGDIDERRKKLKSELQPFADARTSWLCAEFKLSPKQRRRLELAAKGAISKLLDERMAAEEVFAKMLENPGNGNFSSKEARLAMADHATLLHRHSRWRSLMLSVLNEEQKVAFLDLEKRRLLFEQHASLDHATISLTRTLTLNWEQLSQYRKLLNKINPTPDPTNFDLTDQYTRVLKIDEQEMIKAIGEDNWDILKVQLEAIRAQMGSDEEESKDE